MHYRAESEGWGLFPAWITADGNISVPYEFPSHPKHLFNGRVLQSSRGIQGKGLQRCEAGGCRQWARKGVQFPSAHPKPSLPSSTPLYNFQTLFVYCWHLFPSSVAAAHEGRKNMQLEYTKIPLGINRNFFLCIHRRCSWRYTHLKWNKSRPFQHV